MIFISHRGNINGKSIRENLPDYILEAIELGYDVEIDVNYLNGFWLGHDYLQYEIDENFLSDHKNNLWCHAKDIVSLTHMLDIDGLNCFWHQTDDITLTSKNYMWTYPGKMVMDKSIIVLPEIVDKKIYKNAAGICSDFIEKYRNEL